MLLSLRSVIFRKDCLVEREIARLGCRTYKLEEWEVADWAGVELAREELEVAESSTTLLSGANAKKSIHNLSKMPTIIY